MPWAPSSNKEALLLVCVFSSVFFQTGQTRSTQTLEIQRMNGSEIKQRHGQTLMRGPYSERPQIQGPELPHTELKEKNGWAGERKNKNKENKRGGERGE